jgi:hypothetical protein
MEPNQQTLYLVDQTIQAFNGDVTSVSKVDGIVLIDNWISTLHAGDASTNLVANTLSTLKMELQNDNPDGEAIQEQINELVSCVWQTADEKEGSAKATLKELAAALDSFNRQLNGENGAVLAPGENAPMTPIAGSMSTKRI